MSVTSKMHLNLRQTVLGSVALLCVLGPLLGAVAVTNLILTRNDIRSSFLELASKPEPDGIMALSDRHLAAIDLTLVLGSCAVMAALMIGLAIGYFVDRSMLGPIELLTAAMERLRTGETPLARTSSAIERPETSADAYPGMEFLPEYEGRKHEIGALARTLRQFHERGLDVQFKSNLLNSAMANMSQGLCMYDADDRLVVCNSRFQDIYGLPAEAIEPGTPIHRVAEPECVGHDWECDLVEAYATIKAALARDERLLPEQRLADGRTISISAVPTENGGWVATFEDISERRAADARIAHMAHHDALTGLPNRVLFRLEAEQALKRARRGEQLAVIYLDLDGFKAVNDMLGHAIGDRLLVAVADRLRASMRDDAFVARLGGDEFAVVLAVGQPDDLAVLAQRIIETLSTPYDIGDHQLMIGASVGIAVAPTDGHDPDQLLKKADMALYRAKADGRGKYFFFEAWMDERMQARRALEVDLRKALAREEFEVFYQPLVNLQTNEVSSFEALLRWRHPVRGMVGPDNFIPLAEEIGLINEIGAWVLKQACSDAMGWPDHLKLAVNVSSLQFRSNRLSLDVVAALGHSGLPASRLEIEITETALLQDTEATIAVLYELRQLGLSIAMDDFGTGYSSLGYLRKFPFDKIKIDKSFTLGLPDRADSLAIVRAMMGLGVNLGMITTAEGVETEEQLAALRAEGCTEVQGYLFSPARPAGEIAALLSRMRGQTRVVA